MCFYRFFIYIFPDGADGALATTYVADAKSQLRIWNYKNSDVVSYGHDRQRFIYNNSLQGI